MRMLRMVVLQTGVLQVLGQPRGLGPCHAVLLLLLLVVGAVTRDDDFVSTLDLEPVTGPRMGLC